MLVERVEEWSSRSYSKEESKEQINEQNIRLEEELYITADILDRESNKLEKLIENNLLLRQATEEIEMIHLKKRQRKLSKSKRRSKLISPRYDSVKSPTVKSSGKLNSFRTAWSIKSSQRRRKSKNGIKQQNSYNTSRIISYQNDEE